MASSTYPLKGIPQPHPHDVLCGRGGGTNNHLGNSHWRMLVAANKELYVALPKKQKMLLSKSILNAVRSQNPPGRFLQKDSKSETWYDVGDQRAQEKTSQALREGAPVIRTNSKSGTHTNTNTNTNTNPGVTATATASDAASVSTSTSNTEPLTSTASSSSAPGMMGTATPVTGNVNANVNAGNNPQMNMPKVNGHMQHAHGQQHAPAHQQQHQQQQQQQQQGFMMYPGAGMPPQYPTTGNKYHAPPGPGGGYQHAHAHAPSTYALPPTIAAQGPVPGRKPKKAPQPVTPSSHSPPSSDDRFVYEYESGGGGVDDHNIQPLPFSVAATATTHAPANVYTTSTSSTGYTASTSSTGTPVADNVTDGARLRGGYGTTGNNSEYGNGNSDNAQDHADTYDDYDEDDDYEEAHDDYVEPPAGLDPTTGVSFGSIDMTDYEAQLLSGGHSFGSVMSYSYNNNNNNNKYPEQQGDASGIRNHAGTTAEAYAPVHAAVATRPAEASTAAARPATGNGTHAHSASGEATSYDHATEAVAPVDGGLEPTGLSFGSMMSMGTQNDKLEPAGLSFGSMMSVSVKGGIDAVDGGLEAIGTSFGSISLATEDQRKLVRVLEGDQEESVAAMPTFLNATKSKGNLLECSDTDSDGEEDEISAQQRSAQKSADWEKLQSAFQESQTKSMPQSASIPPPMFPGGTPSTLNFNIPNTTFYRDFSQMSAMSAGDEDYRETILPDQIYGAEDGEFSMAMPPPMEVYGGGGGEDDMPPPPPPPMQKQESDPIDWRQLETTYLNRGDSLAEDFLS